MAQDLPTLRSVLLNSERRAAVIDDSVECVRRTVDGLGGMRGLLAKVAFAALPTSMIRSSVDALADEFVAGLERFHRDALMQRRPIADCLLERKDEVAASVMKLVAGRAATASNVVVKQVYSAIRPSDVEGAIPRIAQIIASHVDAYREASPRPQPDRPPVAHQPAAEAGPRRYQVHRGDFLDLSLTWERTVRHLYFRHVPPSQNNPNVRDMIDRLAARQVFEVAHIGRLREINRHRNVLVHEGKEGSAQLVFEGLVWVRETLGVDLGFVQRKLGLDTLVPTNGEHARPS
jgi:hypothetical protein